MVQSYIPLNQTDSRTLSNAYWDSLPEKSQRFGEVTVTVILLDLSTIEAIVVSVSFGISTMNAELCNIIIGL